MCPTRRFREVFQDIFVWAVVTLADALAPSSEYVAVEILESGPNLPSNSREVREAYRKKKFEEEQKASERRLIQKEREAEIQAAAEKKKQDLERLQRLRDHNILRKEKERIARLAAMAA
ncbi:avt5 [Symbiodinium natans]|uniref:Avt5 protein n=1 Tax=Symbiodinium natans TaxID=878477 RepID=A0A812KB18_9DINO|nr:avt5 [Symbiodinium natans]